MAEIAAIMGVYNCEKTVEDSINSILNQTFSDFIYYICDDGSTDNTANIVSELAKKDNRIVFFKNEKNSGLAVTLNRCLDLCDTPFIARMDGDDIAHNDRFEKQINFLRQNSEYNFCGSSLIYFDENGVWGNHVYIEKPNNKSFLFMNPFAHPSMLFRKEAFEKAGKYETEKWIGRSEDYELFMRMYSKGLKGYNFQEPLLSYREQRESYSKRKLKYAFTDAYVRFRGFKSLHLFPKGLIYVIKPIFVGLLPVRIRILLKKKIHSTNIKGKQ